jgi:hypothetical protein
MTVLYLFLSLTSAYPTTSTYPTTTTTYSVGSALRQQHVGVQRWQNCDVRGRVERTACAAAREDRAVTSYIATGRGARYRAFPPADSAITIQIPRTRQVGSTRTTAGPAETRGTNMPTLIGYFAQIGNATRVASCFGCCLRTGA